MAWTVRSVIAAALWVAAGPLTLFFATAAHLIGRRTSNGN